MNVVMKKNAFEWSVFGMSLLLTVSLISYLIYQIFVYNPTPPHLVVRHAVESDQSMHYTVHLTVSNTGGQTAENVKVEVVLYQAPMEEERASITMTYVPKGSEEEGWVTFKTDPAQADSLVTYVLGYTKP